jgi:hypothetical protein
MDGGSVGADSVPANVSTMDCEPAPSRVPALTTFVSLTKALFDSVNEKEPKKRKARKKQRYCICADEADDELMIQCNECLMWYHLECLELEMEDISTDTKDIFYCHFCVVEFFPAGKPDSLRLPVQLLLLSSQQTLKKKNSIPHSNTH